MVFGLLSYSVRKNLEFKAGHCKVPLRVQIEEEDVVNDTVILKARVRSPTPGLPLPERVEIRLRDFRFAEGSRRLLGLELNLPDDRRDILAYAALGKAELAQRRWNETTDREFPSDFTSKDKEVALREFLVWKHQNDIMAYHDLQACQGKSVARFFTSVTLDIATDCPGFEGSDLFQVKGVVVENLPGLASHRVRRAAPRHRAEEMINHVLEAVSNIMRAGVNMRHETLTAPQFVIPEDARSHCLDYLPRAVMTDLGGFIFRQDETDAEWAKLKAQAKEDESIMGQLGPEHENLVIILPREDPSEWERYITAKLLRKRRAALV